VFENHEILTLPRNNEKPSKSIKKIMRFSHCPEIMKNRQKVWKSWDFLIAQKSWKTVKVIKNHESNEIFTLPRNHEKPSKCLKIMKAIRFSHCPEIMTNCQSVWKSSDFHIAQKSWKSVKKYKNHESNEIFTLPRNHEKPSKSLKIMRFSHCPEIMKNRQSV
jgi:hypothetical protein